jgi:ATP-dependent Lon protease
MNPIIIFDELDKVSESHYGKEIIGILTHLTD